MPRYSARIIIMVGIAQRLELLTVAQVVASSNLVTHPNFLDFYLRNREKYAKKILDTVRVYSFLSNFY